MKHINKSNDCLRGKRNAYGLNIFNYKYQVIFQPMFEMVGVDVYLDGLLNF